MARKDEIYTEHLLGSGHLLLYGAQRGWAALRVRYPELTFVTDEYETDLSRFFVNKQNSNKGLAANGSTGDSIAFFEMENADSKKILYTSKNNEILQVFVGMNLPDLWMYRRYKGIVMGETGELGTPSVEKHHGMIRGFQSPLHTPTGFTKMYIPKEVKVEFSFWNPTLDIVQPVFNFVVNTLVVDPIDPRLPENRNLIKNLLTAQIPREVWTADKRNPPDFDIEQYWKVPPIMWNNSKNYTVDGKTYSLQGGR